MYIAVALHVCVFSNNMWFGLQLTFILETLCFETVYKTRHSDCYVYIYIAL